MTDSGCELAKPAIDVGLQTNELDANRGLLDELGIAYNHLLKAGRGVHQHRYDVGRSVLKLNSHRDLLTPGPSGYARLRLAVDPDRARTVMTVDGVAIEAVPHGHDGIVGVEVTWRTADAAEAHRFLVDGIGAHEVDGRYAIGESWIVVEPDPAQPPTGHRNHIGFRYLTVQITDVRREHQRLLDLGFTEGTAPIRLGDTAFISFIRDADGNWIELSQRASLTGPLPDA